MTLHRQLHFVAPFPKTMAQASRAVMATAPRSDSPPFHASRLAQFRLDSRLAWIGGNGAATAAGWLGAIHGERLQPVSAVTRTALVAAVRRLGQHHGLERSFPIPVYDAMAQLGAFATARPGPDRGFVLTVRMLQPAETPPLDEPLRRTFDFTVAEAALGAALHRHGDLQQAASALGVTEGTARTRLQAIFEKTDTHRQVDLLRMLDALADALAD